MEQRFVRPPTKVVVVRRPCGKATSNRWPWRQRPWRRASFVDAPVSSMKTDRPRLICSGRSRGRCGLRSRRQGPGAGQPGRERAHLWPRPRGCRRDLTGRRADGRAARPGGGTGNRHGRRGSSPSAWHRRERRCWGAGIGQRRRGRWGSRGRRRWRPRLVRGPSLCGWSGRRRWPSVPRMSASMQASPTSLSALAAGLMRAVRRQASSAVTPRARVDRCCAASQPRTRQFDDAPAGRVVMPDGTACGGSLGL